jgi:hypothetical protein
MDPIAIIRSKPFLGEWLRVRSESFLFPFLHLLPQPLPAPPPPPTHPSRHVAQRCRHAPHSRRKCSPVAVGGKTLTMELPQRAFAPSAARAYATAKPGRSTPPCDGPRLTRVPWPQLPPRSLASSSLASLAPKPRLMSSRPDESSPLEMESLGEFSLTGAL